MRVAILDDYQDTVRHLDCHARLAGHTVQVFHTPVAVTAQWGARLAATEALILIRERTRITDALLDRLPRLRLICQSGKAGPHLDVSACSRRGVLVTEGSGYAVATAEFTWMLILAARRRLLPYATNLARGFWQQSYRGPHPLDGFGRALAGQALGVWGYGRIGRLVAGYGRAFGMTVVVHGRPASLAAAHADGLQVEADRAAFLARCDIVTLHLKLVDGTRGCVGAADLAAMRPDALLVNTSRAELIAPGALLAAVRAGRPGQAAVDVFETEPLAPTDPLLAQPNVLTTPHLGFVERTSFEALLGGAIDNLNAYAAGAPVNVVNPEALARAADH